MSLKKGSKVSIKRSGERRVPFADVKLVDHAPVGFNCLHRIIIQGFYPFYYVYPTPNVLENTPHKSPTYPITASPASVGRSISGSAMELQR